MRSQDTFNSFTNSGKPVARYLFPYIFKKSYTSKVVQAFCRSTILHRWRQKSAQETWGKSSNFGLSNIAAAGTPTKWKVFSRNERRLPSLKLTKSLKIDHPKRTCSSFNYQFWVAMFSGRVTFLLEWTSSRFDLEHCHFNHNSCQSSEQSQWK